MEVWQTTPFHVAHKVPAGDGLYVRAKHAQLVERDPNKAIVLFRAALEAGDRVDSALKDMAIVLKQQNLPHDAILAILTFRARCSDSTQGSLDNVLLDLYKSCGLLDEQIALLIRKLELFNHNQTFNGKRTKTARSQGKKFQISVDQEIARLLGNLGWAYMQQLNYAAAESAYRKALTLEVDNNKVCNLGLCLMKQGRAEEAIDVLKRASYLYKKTANSESQLKSYERAQDLICKASSMSTSQRFDFTDDADDDASSWASTSSNDSTLDPACHNSMQLHAPGDACSCIDVCSINEDDRKMVEMGSSAGLYGCSNARQEEKVPDRHGDDAGHTIEEVTTFPVDLIDSETTPLLSTDLPWSTKGRRRLPVFQDITVLGSLVA